VLLVVAVLAVLGLLHHGLELARVGDLKGEGEQGEGVMVGIGIGLGIG
jgi:hypothetical protein